MSKLKKNDEQIFKNKKEDDAIVLIKNKMKKNVEQSFTHEKEIGVVSVNQHENIVSGDQNLHILEN